MYDTPSRLGRARSRDAILDGSESAERLWGQLPRDNPPELQRRLCDALAQGANWTLPEIGRYRALRALDLRTARLLTGMLWECAAPGASSPELERTLWPVALELCRAFAGEFERYLKALRTGGLGNGWTERSAEILVRFLFHREIELALTLFRYERWPRSRLKSLHDAYRYAIDTGCARRPVTIGPRGDGAVVEVTPEHAFVRVLLLGLLDGGQFRPDEIARARRAIAGWARHVHLEPRVVRTLGTATSAGFVVDIAGSEGLVRAGATDAGAPHGLDTAPLVEAIAAAERDAAAATDGGAAAKLYARLATVFAPERQIIARRGERVPVALTSVEASVGSLQTIFRLLRRDAAQPAAGTKAASPYTEEISIGDVGQVQVPPAADGAPAPRGEEIVEAATWHVRDRSASGIRLRGRKPGARRLLPGMLIALKDDPSSPWTLGIVRRVARIVGNNLEIGVEQIGRNPQRIVLLAAPPAAPSPQAAKPDRCIALYLPDRIAPCEPARKTLLMPAAEYAAGRVLTLLSTTRAATVRCGAVIERQPDFVWADFEVASPLAVPRA